MRELTRTGHSARLKNIMLLIAGYGCGQGSIFLAQTWLVAHGHLELLALFGTHFAFAMLAIIIVDAGALIALARQAALSFSSEAERSELERRMWQKFWETSAIRAALAIALLSGIVIATAGGLLSVFTRHYVWTAAPALFIWSINAAGLLDGLKLSGISGISGSIAYMASAVALLAVDDMPASRAGLILGSAFTLGYAVTVCVQWVALHLAGWGVRFARPTRHGMATCAKDGLALLGHLLPGQLYYRAQLLMSAAWLGVEPTAIFVYVKQIVTAANQMIGFFFRVEFPALVRNLAGFASHPLRTVWQTQRLGIWLAVGLSAMLCAGGLVTSDLLEDERSAISSYLAMFSVVVVSSAIVLCLGQGLAALRHYRALFTCSSLGSLAGLAMSIATVREHGLLGLFLGDLASTIAGTLVSVAALRRKNIA